MSLHKLRCHFKPIYVVYICVGMLYTTRLLVSQQLMAILVRLLTSFASYVCTLTSGWQANVNHETEQSSTGMKKPIYSLEFPNQRVHQFFRQHRYSDSTIAQQAS